MNALEALGVLIVTALPKATVVGDTEGVVALGIVVPLKVPLKLAEPNGVDDDIEAATEREREPSELCVWVNEPLAIVLLLPAATPLTSHESPVYLLFPPIVTVTVDVPLLYDGEATSILIFNDHEIFPELVVADVPDSVTVNTS